MIARPGAARPGAPAAGLRITLRPHDLVVGFHGTASLRLDGEGRWATYGRNGTFYRRTVDGEVVVRTPEGEPETIAAPAATELHEEIRLRILGLRALLDGGTWPFEGAVDAAALAPRLHEALRWDAPALGGEADRFREAYPEPVAILPPDRTRDVVVLPATGCPNAHCTFCAFYKNARFAPMPAPQLASHLRGIEKLFGRALPGRTGIFLGSASALSLGQTPLLHAMAMASATLGERPRGFGAFADPDHAPRRSVADYRELVGAGLAMVTIGLETGWGALRRKLGKSDDMAPLRIMVEHLHEAGIHCGLSVLAGISPADPARHVDDTAELVRTLPLGPADIVYLSPLQAEDAVAAGAELKRLREALAGRTPARVAPYRIELFRYYA